MPNELTLKIVRILYNQSGMGGNENGTVPKRHQPIMAEKVGRRSESIRTFDETGLYVLGK